MKLHVRRVEMDDRDELIPEWFNFIGVVHAEDLPLRFSREILPQGKASLAKKCFDMFAGTAEENGYSKFCEQFEHFEKFGIIEDSTDLTEIVELLRFNTSMPGVELISFEEVRSLSEEGFERHAVHHW